MTEQMGTGQPTASEHRVRRFLAKPPGKAVDLVLMQAGDDDIEAAQLRLYSREEFSTGLASEIIMALDDAATEMGRDVRAKLYYRDADGSELTSLPLRRNGPPMESAEDLRKAVMAGDSKSVVVLAQTQSLQIQRMYLQSMGEVLKASERRAERNEDAYERLLKRNISLEQEVTALKDALRDAESYVAAGMPDEPSDAQRRALDMFEKIAPVLMQRFLVANAPQQSS